MNTIDHFRTLVLDVDGTLFDTLPSLVAAANEVMTEAGYEAMHLAQLRPALSEGLSALFHRAVSLQSRPVPHPLAEQLESAFHDRYTHRWLLQARLFDGVDTALQACRSQGVGIGICTNRDADSTAALLQTAGLRSYVDCVVSMGDTTLPKPDAAPLLLALRLLQGDPATTLFVGDSGIDAQCARSAGAGFAAHLAGYAEEPAALQPCVVAFSRYEDLGEWLAPRISRVREDVRNA